MAASQAAYASNSARKRAAVQAAYASNLASKRATASAGCIC